MSNQQGKNAMTKTAEPEPFLEMLKSHAGQIQAALPRTFDLDRMIRLATTEFRLQPKLKECVPASVFGAVVQASALALDFSLRHCFLVPYKRSRKGRNGWESWHECQLIISFQGYIELARRSGEINDIDAHVVYEGDEFDYQYGTTKFLKHRPTLGTRGKRLAAYAVANFKNGSSMFDVMPWLEVDKIKQRSKSRDKDSGEITGPWATDEDEMARKTAVRRLAKYLPLSVELRRALDLEDASAMGKQQHLENAVGIIAASAKGTYEPIPQDDDDDGLEPSGDDAQAQAGSGEGSQDEPPFDTGTTTDELPEERPGRPRKSFTKEKPADKPAADEKPATSAKGKTLYRELNDRINSADTFEALADEETGIRSLEAGAPPHGITEENRAVLLAAIGRRRKELS